LIRRSRLANNQPSDDETSGTTSSEGVTRTDEKTSTNGATDSNHLQVSRLHSLLKSEGFVLDKLGRSVTLEFETPSHKLGTSHIKDFVLTWWNRELV
jgi:hypothetical protein